MINLDRQQLPRRRALALAGAAVATLAGCARGGQDSPPHSARPSTDAAVISGATANESSRQAWSALVEGNARFARGKPSHPHASPARRQAVATEQTPIACVLGCADSRVPPEMVFDQGLGDLFTVRSAGEVLDEAVLGSVEYAVEHLAVPLVVVLGHSGCGAVKAAVDAVHEDGHAEGNVAALVQAIEPAVRSVANGPATSDGAGFLSACVAEQTRRIAAAVEERSSAIRTAADENSTAIVAAVYDLATGRIARTDV